MGDTLPTILEENVAQKLVSHKLMQELVEELTKDNPDSDKVKTLSEKLDLPYSADPVIQISTVLQSMNNLNKNRKSDIDFEVF